MYMRRYGSHHGVSKRKPHHYGTESCSLLGQTNLFVVLPPPPATSQEQHLQFFNVNWGDILVGFAFHFVEFLTMLTELELLCSPSWAKIKDTVDGHS